MSIESKKDLPKRYQELADEAGFKAVLDSLDKSPADMTAVAEVEKQVEDLRAELFTTGTLRGVNDEIFVVPKLRDEIIPPISRYHLRESVIDHPYLGTQAYVQHAETSATSWIALWIAIIAFAMGLTALIF